MFVSVVEWRKWDRAADTHISHCHSPQKCDSDNDNAFLLNIKLATA